MTRTRQQAATRATCFGDVRAGPPPRPVRVLDIVRGDGDMVHHLTDAQCEWAKQFCGIPMSGPDDAQCDMPTLAVNDTGPSEAPPSHTPPPTTGDPDADIKATSTTLAGPTWIARGGGRRVGWRCL